MIVGLHVHRDFLPSFNYSGVSVFVNVLGASLVPATDLSFPKAL